MVRLDDDRLDECLARWERAADAGQNPTPLELCPDGDTEFLSAVADGIACLRRFRAGFGATVPEPDDAAGSFRADGYEGIEEIEEGGQGQVIRARDRRLGREVAVKVPKARWAWMAAVTRRFEREAHISGNLEHPGVVPIYGFGRDAAGRPYYAMRYVRKERTLEQAITAVHALPPGADHAVAYQNLLRQFLAVCRTVAYAHDRGVIHRDLKPANVLVGEYGEVFVVDWGLAKELRDEDAARGAASRSGDPHETAAGSRTVGVLGTPAYMSPEQAEDAGQVGPPADVYSLGATLYHVLTARAPFVGEGGGLGAVVERVKTGTFTPPHRLNPAVPRALAAVCLKAMSRDPVDRYTGAGELASEIERWLADEPVKAWRDPLPVRVRRWARRHRTVVAAGLVLLAMGVVTLAVAAWLMAETNRQREEFVGQLQRTNTDLADAVYRNQFSAAHAAWEQMDVARAEAILDECDPDRRSFEWHYLKDLCRGQQKSISAGKPVRAVATSPGGKWIAVTDTADGIRVLDPATGEARPLPKGEPEFHWRGQTAAFRPDGNQVAAVVKGKWPADLGGDFVLAWNPATGEARDPIPVLLSGLAPLQSIILGYRDGGRELAVVYPEAKARLRPGGGVENASELSLRCWDSASGKWLRDIPLGVPVSGGYIDGVLSPDGKRLALWLTQSVRLVHVGGGKEFPLKGHTETVNAAAFSPDGKLLATASDDATVRVWDASDGRELLVLEGHRLPVRAVAFSPDGKLLASGGEDRGIKIWDAASGREVMTLRGHPDRIDALVFLDNGRLVSGGNGGGLRVWRVAPAETQVVGGVPDIYTLRFSPDGTRLYSGHIGENPFGPRKVRITNPANVTAEEFPAVCSEFSLSPNGDTLAAVVKDGVELWDVPGRKKLRTVENARGPLAFAPDGSRLALLSREEKEIRPAQGDSPAETERTVVLVLDPATGEVRHRLDHDRAVEAAVWHPGGGRLFTLTRTGTVTAWEAAKWTAERRFDTGQADEQRVSRFHLMAVSSDGRFLATTGNDKSNTVRVWNPETGELRWEQKAHLRCVTALAFSPDSRRLATASEDRTVRLWEAATGRELLSMPGVRHTPYVLAFSPDGVRLACACQVSLREGQILLWGRKPGG